MCICLILLTREQDDLGKPSKLGVAVGSINLKKVNVLERVI